MQKKLALIEPHQHSEVLRTFAQLFLHLGWELHIFTNAQVQQDCYVLAENSSIQWYIQKEEKTTSFLQQQKPQINKCQLAIFVTVVSDYAFFSRFSLKPKTILIIHNGNTFFDPRANRTWAPTWPGRLKDLGRLLRTFFKQETKQRQILLYSFDYLSMADLTMSRYFSMRPHKVVAFDFVPPLPFVFYEGTPQEYVEEKEGISIAIPGVVRGEGKDYEKVWKAFAEVVPNLKQPVTLDLLGNASSKYGQQVIRRFQDLETEWFTVRYHRDLIPQEAFDRQLAQADFLILPLKAAYRLGSIREIYGHTNISGGVNDMLRFGTPALISPHYPLPSPLQQLTQTYTSAPDLAELLSTWIAQGAFHTFRKGAPALLAPYRKEHWAEEVDTWINEILSQ